MSIGSFICARLIGTAFTVAFASLALQVSQLVGSCGLAPVASISVTLIRLISLGACYVGMCIALNLKFKGLGFFLISKKCFKKPISPACPLPSLHFPLCILFYTRLYYLTWSVPLLVYLKALGQTWQKNYSGTAVTGEQQLSSQFLEHLC